MIFKAATRNRFTEGFMSSEINQLINNNFDASHHLPEHPTSVKLKPATDKKQQNSTQNSLLLTFVKDELDMDA